MPSEKQHIKKAAHNEQFFDHVKHDYPDWAMTGLFYSVLHYIEAYLATKGIHVEDHKERAKHVGLLAPLKPYYADYRRLYDYSVNARYKMHEFNVTWLNDTHKRFFLPIKTSILKLIKKR